MGIVKQIILLSVLVWANFAYAESLFDRITGFLQSEPKKPSRCFLYGKVSNSTSTSGSNFQNLKNQIKLHLDANTLAKCQQLAKSYCKHNIMGARLVPQNMTLTFRPENEESPTNKYKVGITCELIEK